MRTIIKYFGVTLCLLILVSVLSCVKRTVSECQSKKIELLLEDMFKKRSHFSINGSSSLTTKDPYLFDESDSSMYFNYLYSANLKIPDKEFYLYENKYLDPSYPDSVKLREISDPFMRNRHAQTQQN